VREQLECDLTFTKFENENVDETRDGGKFSSTCLTPYLALTIYAFSNFLLFAPNFEVTGNFSVFLEKDEVLTV
jgi:hypothetical protein